MKNRGTCPKPAGRAGMFKIDPQIQTPITVCIRRGARAADRAALEMPCTRKGTAGSNPALSARLRLASSEYALADRLRLDSKVGIVD